MSTVCTNSVGVFSRYECMKLANDTNSNCAWCSVDKQCLEWDACNTTNIACSGSDDNVESIIYSSSIPFGG